MSSNSEIGIVDYGIGNIRSLQNALETVGANTCVSGDAEKLNSLQKIILPGVGAFGACVRALKERNLFDFVIEFANSKRPLLGICVGMQLLFERSMEFGETAGASLLLGDVVDIRGLLSVCRNDIVVPNVGWRTIEQNKDKIGFNELLFDGIRSDDEFYFVHSFGVSSNNKHVIASSVYEDIKFAAAVGDGNVFGLQFHPEKSRSAGLKILSNFVQFDPAYFDV